jgi:hypothetical protein
MLRRPFGKKQCVDLSAHAREMLRRFSIDLRIQIDEACEALCTERSIPIGGEPPNEDLCSRTVGSCVLRYRRGQPGEYSKKCGRNLTARVEWIEAA